MKRLFQKQKTKQSNSTEVEQDALLSPNLFSHDLFIKDELNAGQRTFVIICKATTLVILAVFFITLAINLLNARIYSKRLEVLNNQAQELSLYFPVENRVNDLGKRIALHKKLAPKRKNFVDKVSATLGQIGTNTNLQDFTYKEGALTVKIKREDILDITALISRLIEQDYIREIAILSADLNPAEKFYTVRLEIAYK